MQLSEERVNLNARLGCCTCSHVLKSNGPLPSRIVQCQVKAVYSLPVVRDNVEIVFGPSFTVSIGYFNIYYMPSGLAF